MKIAIDFDGTVVEHQYPEIGKDIGAEPVLKALIENGHQLILNTMRSGELLNEAIIWFRERDIFLYGINKEPGQESWTSSPKVHAQLYIDDHGLGVPLNRDGYVDWYAVALMLYKMGFISKEQWMDLNDNEEFIKVAGYFYKK